LNIFQTIFNYY